MKDVDFNDLVSALKASDKTKVKQEIRKNDGVLKETVLYIAPHTVTIEYIDFGRSQTALKFFAQKDGEEDVVYFKTIQQLSDTLGIAIDLYADTTEEFDIKAQNAFKGAVVVNRRA